MNGIVKYIVVLACGAALFGCSTEDSLLDPKVYFGSTKESIEMSDGEPMSIELQSRLSTHSKSRVNVTYTIADESVVDAYNKMNGTEYIAFKGASLSAGTSVIEPGDIFAEPITVDVTDFSEVKAGKTYLLPVRVGSSDLPVISGQDIVYYVLKNPVKITTAADFGNGWPERYITMPLTNSHTFEACTYEALINVSGFSGNATIMGCEGVMIVRIGDSGGGVPEDRLEVAGKAAMFAPEAIKLNRWYHIALTCSEADKKAVLYVNGKKVSEAGLPEMPSNLVTATEGFSVGLVPGFKWGTRPFYGMMSEVRLWTIARTEDQIRENMLSVDPASEGLLVYYKLDGKVEDATPNGMNPSAHNIDTFTTFDTPIAIQ